MTMTTTASNLVRYEGDPHVIKTGPSSMSPVDRMARLLGWFSIGLGLTEAIAPGRITRTLGVEGSENLVRACGMREIGTGLLCLSLDEELGLWSRVAGDGLDLTTLLMALKEDNPEQDNVRLAMALVAGVMLLDILTAQSVRQRHKQGDGMRRDYGDRSGFPHGVEAARGAARTPSRQIET